MQRLSGTNLFASKASINIIISRPSRSGILLNAAIGNYRAAAPTDFKWQGTLFGGFDKSVSTFGQLSSTDLPLGSAIRYLGVEA